MKTLTNPKKVLATSNSSSSTRATVAERALLVHIHLARKADEDDVTELHRLAESAGAMVCESILGRRQRPDAASFIGKGKAQEVRTAVMHHSASLVIVNHSLTPVQERNLENTVGCRVMDRTDLILDIFAQRARSHEGKLQVELAQLEHLSTRLVRGWTHLERQKGGIGLRGPGETQLETDRRLLRLRIKKLNQRLAKLRTQRKIRRRARNKVPIPTVALVGYTNAGKSTLFNRVTGAEVYSADQLFATLDPTMRRVDLAGNTTVVLADTVGFIRHLPHDLVEAFKSTLDEVTQADLLLHIVDASHPDKLDYIKQVNSVLSEIDAQAIPQIIVYNKIDQAGASARYERDASGLIHRVWLSAETGEGVENLVQALSDYFRRQRLLIRLKLPPEAGRLRSLIYEKMAVLNETNEKSGGWLLEVELDRAKLDWLQSQHDYRPEFWILESPAVLARTGS